ncbi:MAG: hypothetical protein ACO20H_13100 [Bacteriovoracaceae bacterium]
MYSDTLEFSHKASSVGEACSSSRGRGQRKAEKVCVSKGLKFNWNKTKFGECEHEKLGPKEYKATWNIKYVCSEKN